MPRAVAVLEVMWDWQLRTSMANPSYLAQAPRCFRINPENHSGRRLYDWLGHEDLLVTNACPELVDSAKGRGTPDTDWLRENVEMLKPREVLLVCGKIAQETFDKIDPKLPASCRILYLPHPAARLWTANRLEKVRKIVQGKGGTSLHVSLKDGRLRARVLCKV